MLAMRCEAHSILGGKGGGGGRLREGKPTCKSEGMGDSQAVSTLWPTTALSTFC